MSTRTPSDVRRLPHPDAEKAEKDEKASTPLTPVDVRTFHEARERRKKRRKRRRKKKLSYGHVPVWAVFWGLLVLAGGAYYSGSIAAGMAVSSLIMLAYVIDDRHGFAWSKRSRRSYKVRTNFNQVEIFSLGVVLLVFLYDIGMYWVTRLAF